MSCKHRVAHIVHDMSHTEPSIKRIAAEHVRIEQRFVCNQNQQNDRMCKTCNTYMHEDNEQNDKSVKIRLPKRTCCVIWFEYWQLCVWASSHVLSKSDVGLIWMHALCICVWVTRITEVVDAARLQWRAVRICLNRFIPNCDWVTYQLPIRKYSADRQFAIVSGLLPMMCLCLTCLCPRFVFVSRPVFLLTCVHLPLSFYFLYALFVLLLLVRFIPPV